MTRKSFLRKSLLGTSILAVSSLGAKAAFNDIEEVKALDIVGFNHLPTNISKMDNMVIHRADSRGHANLGWLNSYHSFSFANYYNPERMHFGVLRVLNDDTVAGGKGFGTHPHDNMEIISIPLSGALVHRDSMGNEATIRQGEIQVMSAGTGIKHSEYNAKQEEEVKFLQIWLFPRSSGVAPRYDQLPFDLTTTPNTFQQILSPSADDAGVWIHQDAWFSMGQFDAQKSTTYTLHKPTTNGVYALVLAGEVVINGQTLGTRDAIGLWNTAEINVLAASEAKILLLEVPMALS